MLILSTIVFASGACVRVFNFTANSKRIYIKVIKYSNPFVLYKCFYVIDC